MVALGVGVFVGTDVDDLLVLTLLFLAARSVGLPSVRQIVVGQFLGIAALVLGAAAIAAGLLAVPGKWVGLLGLVPLALGIRGFVARSDDHSPVTATSAASIALLTVANGADNLAVYVPLFRTISFVDSLLVCAVFALMVGVWLALASWLGGHQRIVAAVERFGSWIVPAVFCVIGIAVILRSGLLR